MYCEHIRIGAAVLDTYFLESVSGVTATEKRPCIIVLPGGGYQHLSSREGEPVALRFCGEGFHTCVVRYSVAPAAWPQALVEVAASVAWVRLHVQEWGIDTNRIVLMGFSAGGHLVGCLAAFWHDARLLEQVKTTLATDSIEQTSLKPDGLVLGYPVITSGEFAHRGSFQALCGSDETLIESLSLEKCVGDSWPRTFIWHTFDDQSVPVENSLLLAHALHKAGISAELHVFPHAPHGSALGTRETAMDKCASPDEASGNAMVQPDTVALWPIWATRWIQSL